MVAELLLLTLAERAFAMRLATYITRARHDVIMLCYSAMLPIYMP